MACITVRAWFLSKGDEALHLRQLPVYIHMRFYGKSRDAQGSLSTSVITGFEGRLALSGQGASHCHRTAAHVILVNIAYGHCIHVAILCHCWSEHRNMIIACHCNTGASNPFLTDIAVYAGKLKKMNEQCSHEDRVKGAQGKSRLCVAHGGGASTVPVQWRIAP